MWEELRGLDKVGVSFFSGNHVRMLHTIVNSVLLRSGRLRGSKGCTVWRRWHDGDGRSRSFHCAVSFHFTIYEIARLVLKDELSRDNEHRKCCSSLVLRFIHRSHTANA